MKKLFGILTLATIFIFTACEVGIGPMGPEGPMGPPGEDGTSFLGNVFDVEGDFTASNYYELFYDFPSNFEIYETDVVLVYILWEQVNGSNNQTVDVWRPLPQTRILDEGILQYNFDYTYENVRIFLDGDVNFGNLNEADKFNQVFRIVVLPADYAEDESIDVENINSVMNFLNIENSDVQKANF